MTTAQDVLHFFLDRAGFDGWWRGIDFETREEIETDLDALLEKGTEA